MKFENSLNACFDDCNNMSTIETIEFLENTENSEKLFGFWNSLGQYSLSTVKSNSLFKRIVACLSEEQSTDLSIRDRGSIMVNTIIVEN